MAVVTGRPAFWQTRAPHATLCADDETLRLGAGQHDLVVHDLSLHWASDPVGQLVQCRLAMKPDGLLIATLFGGQTLHELRTALAEAESRITGGLSPRVAPMADIRDVGGLLQRAGFALPVADSQRYDVHYASMVHLMHDLRAMGEGNALAARLRRPTRRAVLDAAAQTYARHFATADGKIHATFEVITLTGWVPADNQQKPLRPGSAQTRLADALGTTEHDANKSGE
jgi:hypothetical protein